MKVSITKFQDIHSGLNRTALLVSYPNGSMIEFTSNNGKIDCYGDTKGRGAWIERGIESSLKSLVSGLEAQLND